MMICHGGGFVGGVGSSVLAVVIVIEIGESERVEVAVRLDVDVVVGGVEVGAGVGRCVVVYKDLDGGILLDRKVDARMGATEKEK